jgi:hypothetical protein
MQQQCLLYSEQSYNKKVPCVVEIITVHPVIRFVDSVFKLCFKLYILYVQSVFDIFYP